ncbi:hypothetical protein L21SP3_00611 [Sedimentisphaera cyanobacteriorum]|uniref:Uncharacterized protein n=1 Tax=Sedimentisphaera cyanobacteriorum TaxID=1940790 RepID=A0A1Q2HN89_9BACT|nr:HYExAFE family protein [Sedimentisphaera cyanobacteriorum]AQQ08820.1 hypothetical protein L21SP3_00611 [Sedimentisphaera cyanobacteriorum]
MRNCYKNVYETVFSYWLEESGLDFEYIPQSGKTSLKRFDFLVSFPDFFAAVELKGRTVRTRRKITCSSFQNWITSADRDFISKAKQEGFVPLFVFAYRLDNPFCQCEYDIDYTLSEDRFIFRAVEAEKYLQNARVRSPRWNTICLSSMAFQELAIPAAELLNRKTIT